METPSNAQAPTTIAGALLDFPGVASDAALGAVTRDREVMRIKSNVAKIPGLAWQDVEKEIENAARGLLDIELSDVVVGAWSKYQELRQYRDTKRYPADETVLAPLATHRIKSSHKPYLELLIGDQPAARIEFQLDVELLLEGVVLKIRDGRIWDVKSGTCRCAGKFSCAGVALIEKKTKRFSFRGAVHFERGIPIP